MKKAIAAASPKAPKIVVRELKGSQAKIIYPLIRQLNPKMTKAAFTRLLADMQKQGYRCAAAYEGKNCVGAVGVWIGTRFYCEKYIDIDNVVVDEKCRGQGIGERMMEWAESLARKEKCRIAVLDSYAHNTGSHRFYFRIGYTILGYHFSKKL